MGPGPPPLLDDMPPAGMFGPGGPGGRGPLMGTGPSFNRPPIFDGPPRHFNGPRGFNDRDRDRDRFDRRGFVGPEPDWDEPDFDGPGFDRPRFGYDRPGFDGPGFDRFDRPRFDRPMFDRPPPFDILDVSDEEQDKDPNPFRSLERRERKARHSRNYRSPGGDFECRVCNLTMSNEFQFKNHMESRRHKMNHPMGRNSMDDEDML